MACLDSLYSHPLLPQYRIHGSLLGRIQNASRKWDGSMYSSLAHRSPVNSLAGLEVVRSSSRQGVNLPFALRAGKYRIMNPEITTGESSFVRVLSINSFTTALQSAPSSVSVSSPHPTPSDLHPRHLHTLPRARQTQQARTKKAF